jgi:MFS family permease
MGKSRDPPAPSIDSPENSYTRDREGGRRAYNPTTSFPHTVTSGFVLGFVVGPLLWAPLSEVFGRRYLFIFTYILFTIFNGGVIASQNIWTLIILRFFAGTAGSSPLTNAG